MRLGSPVALERLTETGLYYSFCEELTIVLSDKPYEVISVYPPLEVILLVDLLEDVPTL